ncbi:MAG: archaellar assembly protein FlaJ [Methanolinea sp.]|nr:archaellar assembly protein FlaJ [Methanolinea sp.]
MPFEGFGKSLRGANAGKLPFQDLGGSIKKKLGSMNENKQMGPDLLFMLTYMASITTAQATRPEIFEYTACRKEYVPTKYIERIEFFVKRWNYSYVQGLGIMADRIKNDMLRSMLHRYANSIESGVPDEDFLNRELATIRSVYRNDYEQGLEMLKKWSDAYIAMLFSANLIGIIIMLSIAIFSPDDIQATLRSAYFIVLAISVFGIITMYKSVPADDKTHSLDRGSKEQAIIHRLEKKIIPIALISAVILYFFSQSAGLTMIFLGVLLLPLGIIGYFDDRNIVQRDAEFTMFIRSLGAVMGGKGITIASALAEIDRKSMEYLEPFIAGVNSKLNLGLDEKLAWERFIGESGSNLIYKYLNIFRDSVELGGQPDKIGAIIGSSMLEQVLLREKRNAIAMGFIILIIPMHAMMVGIFLFLYFIMLVMSKAIATVVSSLGSSSTALSSSSSATGSIGGGLSLFVNFPEAEMGLFVLIMVSIVLIANTIAAKIVMGGDRYMYYFFAGLLLVLTGVVYIAAPLIVDMFFSIPTFEAV